MAPTVLPSFRQPSHHSQRGVAAVEFAVIVFVLLLIGAGLVEFGRTLWYYDALAKGTRDAARYMSTVPTGSLGTGATTGKDIVVQAAAAAGIPGFTAANVTVACQPLAGGDCSAASAPSSVSRIRVEASLPVTLGVLFPFILPEGSTVNENITLTPHTTMRYMW